jgi:hypothetical protein
LSAQAGNPKQRIPGAHKPLKRPLRGRTDSPQRQQESSSPAQAGNPKQRIPGAHKPLKPLACDACPTPYQLRCGKLCRQPVTSD